MQRDRREAPGAHGHPDRRRLRRDRGRPRGRGADPRRRSPRATARADGGVLLNGGNCLGIISAPGRYNTFFIPPHKLPVREGPGRGLASISQSGAYLVSQISNLDGVVAAALRDLVRQPDGRDGLRLPRVPRGRPGHARLRRLPRGLPARRRGALPGRGPADHGARGGRVLLYKAGRTREGSAAAASHTASAVGDYEVCEELARAAGAVVAESLDQFEDDVDDASRSSTAGAAAGRRVAVLSNAGFEATAAADTLHGLELAAARPSPRARGSPRSCRPGSSTCTTRWTRRR